MNFLFPHYFTNAFPNLETAGVAADPTIRSGSPVIRAVDFATLYEGAAQIRAFVNGGEVNVASRSFPGPVKAADLNASADLVNGGVPFWGSPAAYVLGSRIYDSVSFALGDFHASPIATAAQDAIKSLWTVAGGYYGSSGNLYGATAGTRVTADPMPTASRGEPIKRSKIVDAWSVLRRRAVVAHYGDITPVVDRSYQSEYFVYAFGGYEVAGDIGSNWQYVYRRVPNLRTIPIGAAAITAWEAVIYTAAGVEKAHIPFIMHVPLTVESTTASTVTFASARSMSGAAVLSAFKSGCATSGYPIGGGYNGYIKSNWEWGSGGKYNALLILDFHKSDFNRLVTG